ncbi:MAG: glycosyltransferase family 4 protein [Gemmatimonadota bacterium]|nr:MAG: glycosyltransferase family 4 protein [Gemmatimonadota bacterium]
MGRRVQAEHRVLLVAPQPFYEDRGTPIAVRRVLEALSGIGYRVDVLTFPMGQSVPIPGVRYIRLRDRLGIRHVPIGFSLRKVWLDCGILLALLGLLRRERYQVVHAVEEAAFMAAVTAGGRGIPVIYDMQSSIPEQLATHWFFGTPPLQAFLRACEHWLLRRVDSVACSRGLESRVKTVVPTLPVREWQYPSTIADASDADVTRLRSKLGVDRDTKVVLYAGNFEDYQGVSLLVEAIPAVRARVSDVLFVLVGADGRGGSEMEELLRSVAPVDCYRILQRQPRESMASFFRLADVVVSPRTHGSNLPLKTLEYLAAGCATVLTDIPAHSGLAGLDLAVMVEPDAAALSSAIADLLEDEVRISQMRGAAKAYAESHLSPAAFVRSVKELYESVQSDA